MRRFIASGLLTALALATVVGCSSSSDDSRSTSTTKPPAPVNVPADFPRTSVPLPKSGTIDAVGTDSSDGKQFFTVTYVVPAKDLSTALADYTQALQGAGYQVTPTTGTGTDSGTGEPKNSGFTAQGSKWDVVVGTAGAGSQAGDGSFTLQVRRNQGP